MRMDLRYEMEIVYIRPNTRIREKIRHNAHRCVYSVTYSVLQGLTV